MQSNIRNFCIIAHIDHGKSTLADRLLEMTGTVAKRDMQEQILDSNPIERERGITIKLAPVRMVYQPSAVRRMSYQTEKLSDSLLPSSEAGKAESLSLKADSYILNLIDTPGHVDFNYEVSRSLQACEGALLVVDSTQGVQAQTLANLYLARKLNLKIIPLINKIDLPNAQIENTQKQLLELGFDKADMISISAKTGTYVDQVLKAIIEKIPPPHGKSDQPLRALVFSSQYDTHKGVVCYVRVVDGEICPQLSGVRQKSFQPSAIRQSESSGLSAESLKLNFLASGTEITPIEIGYFMPKMKPCDSLNTGEVGYIATGLKDVKLAKVGDTVTLQSSIFSSRLSDTGLSVSRLTGKLKTEKHISDNRKQKTDNRIMPLPGYKEPKPMVFLGLYPIQSDEITEVREALGKLKLSDSAFTYRPISSLALGNGFHCGFLGLLHAEIVQERISREFNLSLLATAPSVEYRIKLKVHSSKFPSMRQVDEVRSRNDIKAKTSENDDGTISTIKQPHNDNNLLFINSATDYPDPSTIDQAFEPVMQVIIFSPKKYVGAVMQLCQDKRGEYIDLEYVSGYSVIPASEPESSNEIPGQARDTQPASGLVRFTYLLPLSEMIVDFFDKLKSATEGYASLDYEFFDYQPVDLAKLDILLNHEKVDAFSQLVVSQKASFLGKMMVEKLKNVIPRHQFAVPIQAAIGATIIARSDVKPFRKDVIQKLYGGDRSRKDKLLEAQKKGKSKLKLIGRVEVPQSAFLEVFKSN